jgi:hypothetical protein
MSPAKVHPEENIWTIEYLLVHCQGYRVESAEGRLGYVEEVVQDPQWGIWGEPVSLRVRTDAGILAIPIEDVLDLHPNGKRLVVRTRLARSDHGRGQHARQNKRELEGVAR